MRDVSRSTASATLVVGIVVAVGCGRANPSSGDELLRFGRFLRDVHPDVHRFVTRDALDAILENEATVLDALEDGGGAPGTAPHEVELRTARGYQRVLAAVRDAHLALALPSGQPGAPDPLPLLPVLVRWVEDRGFVDAATAPWPRGTEVLAIDGVALATIRAEIEPLIVADGENPDARAATLHREFTKLYHLAFGARRRYEVSVRLPDGTRDTRTLDAVERDGLGSLQAVRHSAVVGDAVSPGQSAGEPAWPWLIREEARSILRVPTFGIADMDAFTVRVDAAFADVDPALPLILDLRGNEGGFRTGAIAILQHLLAEPYTEWVRVQAKVRRMPRAHRARTDLLFGDEAGWRALFRDPPVDGLYAYEGDPLAQLMTGGDEVFEGEVVVLVDGATNSAANELVLTLRHHRPSIRIVGEEIGGECAQHTGELPVVYGPVGSDVRMLVSVFRITHLPVPGCRVGRGLMPDVAVRYTVDDFLAGRDPFLAALDDLDGDGVPGSDSRGGGR